MRDWRKKLVATIVGISAVAMIAGLAAIVPSGFRIICITVCVMLGVAVWLDIRSRS